MLYLIKNNIDIIIRDKNVDIKNTNFLVFINIDNTIIDPQRKKFAILKSGSFVLFVKYLLIKYAKETNIIVSAIVKLVIFINISK